MPDAGIMADDGWVAAGGPYTDFDRSPTETWTYASADSPTFTFTVNADVTAKYTPGMRVKITQTTVKYFIVTAVSTFSGGNTTITVYGGTDYTLANASITSPYYSSVKAPVGFPLDPAKWTVTATDTNDRSQASPTLNTWYNLGSFSISVPIGVWDLEYSVIADGQRGSAGSTNILSALSTSSSSVSDATFGEMSVGASVTRTIQTHNHRKPVAVAAKTTYYLLASTNTTSMSALDFRGDLITTTITARCAYL